MKYKEDNSKHKVEKDIPKYLKKKESAVSKSKMKSKHKHQYKDCLFNSGNSFCKGQYCVICGRIGKINYFETEKTEDNRRILLISDKILEKYKGLPIFEVDTNLKKYISITESDSDLS